MNQIQNDEKILLNLKFEKYNGKWIKYDYLENDSVYKYDLYGQFKKTKCINSKNNSIHFRFYDDKLLYTKIEYSFDDDFKNLKIAYDSLINQFKIDYNNTERYITEDTETHEKIGELHKVIINSEVIGENQNFHLIEIGYNIEIKWNKINYTLYINHINTFCSSKIDGRGY